MPFSRRRTCDNAEESANTKAGQTRQLCKARLKYGGSTVSAKKAAEFQGPATTTTTPPPWKMSPSFLPSFLPYSRRFLEKLCYRPLRRNPSWASQTGGRAGERPRPRPIDGSEGKGEREGERERERERPQDLLFLEKRARDSVAPFFHLTARPSLPPSLPLPRRVENNRRKGTRK